MRWPRWFACLAAACLAALLWRSRRAAAPLPGVAEMRQWHAANTSTARGARLGGARLGGARLANYYDDPFTVYDCGASRHKQPGALPDFLVAGVHKGGSTALYSNLVRHGHVRPSSCKETGFFARDERWAKGLAFYRRHFFARDFSGADAHVLTGEGTPSYVRIPAATRRIYDTVPGVKAVVSLRDPTERFISHFVGFRERGLTDKSCDVFWREQLGELRACASGYAFEAHAVLPTEVDGVNAQDALRAALGRQPMTVAGASLRGLSRCAADDAACKLRHCTWVLHENALVRSVYVDQVARWLRFFPPEQLLLVQAERMFADVPGELQRVARFLGLRPFSQRELGSLATKAIGSNHRSNPLADTCDRPEMRRFFAPQNDLLAQVVRARWPSLAQRWTPWPEQ